MSKYIYDIATECYTKYGIYPISFSFPRQKVVPICTKTKTYAHIVPNKLDTYIFNSEDDYMHDYNISRYGYTCKKAGWDCMRHLEIMGSNCIPYMTDIGLCPKYTMIHYPKNDMVKVLTKSDVDVGNHFTQYLTCDKMVEYIFDMVDVVPMNVLFIDDALPSMPDYLSVMTLIGLKDKLGSNCDVLHPVDYIYKSTTMNTMNLYGKGFNYTKVLDDTYKCLYEVNHKYISTIHSNIIGRKYDLIVYGSIGRSLSLLEHIIRCYPTSKVVGMYGEDHTDMSYVNRLKLAMNVFVREICME